MMTLKEFKLPDVGEGLTEAEIVGWRVKPGDTVRVNDIVVEIETAKSLVELPCPYAGTVADLLVAEGETVLVGTPIIAVAPEGADVPSPQPAAEAGVDEAAAALAAQPSAPDDVAGDGVVEAGLIGGAAPGGRTSVLVGYGPRTTEAKRRPRKGAAAPDGEPLTPSPEGPAGRVLAKPPVRKLAKDLGVNLLAVTPSGLGGVITRSDVEALAGAPSPRAGTPPGTSAAPVRPGGETRIPVKGVRKMTAEAMVRSAFTAPHVTEWLTLDVTRMVELVERLKADREFADVRVSPLLVVAKAVCLAVRRTPELNATWDESAQEIVLKHGVNLGIAAATPRGLVVPNIVGADAMGLHDLAAALGELVGIARDGRTQPAQMAGGTFTITNVGVFGVDAGTPILNPGETGILALGSVSRRPWVVDGPDGEQVVPRWVTTLALSFDHRVVDGAQGSRFLADVGRLLSDPATAMLY